MSIAALFTGRRLTRLTGYASVQIAVQAIAFAAGIALVHYLDQTHYGYYTLAISMVGVANVLLDLGLATAVLATGGPLHKQPSRLGALLGDAFGIQRKMLLAGSLLLVPIFAAMFFKQGLAATDVLSLSLLAISCTAFNVHNAVALSLVRLRGDLVLQQRLDLGVNLGKLALVLAAAMLYLDAQVAVLLNLVAAAAMYWLLRRYIVAQLGGFEHSTHEHSPALRAFIRRQAPNTVYYCFVGQIAIWLVGMFGNADRVAEVGALGRLGAFFAVIGAVVTAIVQPYFARTGGRRELMSGFIAINAFFAALTATLIGLALVAPQALLWILGPRYAGLTAEVVWLVLAASFGAWGGAVYAASAARGWLVPASLMIPLGLATLAVSIWAFDVATVSGSLKMGSAIGGVALALAVCLVWSRLAGMKRLQEHTP